MAINISDLFTRMGKAFASSRVAIQSGRDARTRTEAYTDLYGGDAVEKLEIGTAVISSINSVYSGASSHASSMASSVSSLIIKVVEDDNPAQSGSLKSALLELRAQMITAASTIKRIVVAAVASPAGGNVGNGLVFASTKRGDGLVNELLIAETIDMTVSSTAVDGSAVLQLVGQPPAGNFDWDWPLGSGTNKTLLSHTGASSSNVVPNGTFETVSVSDANLPSSWLPAVGKATPGTTIKVNAFEVQQLEITGTPTSGYFILSFTNAVPVVQDTQPIPFNSGASAVQSALRALLGLEGVTVVTTGTAPNFFHAITMVGVPSPAQMTSAEFFDTGGITVTTPTPVTALILRGGRSLEFDSDAAEATTVIVQLTGLKPATRYGIGVHAVVDVIPAAGTLVIKLVDSADPVAATIIQDDQGVNNSYTIDATALTSGYVLKTASFITPTELPAVIYLSIGFGTVVSAGTSLFIDDVTMIELDELYAGGPAAVAISGGVNWDLDDTFTLTITSDRGGSDEFDSLQEWMQRALNLNSLGVILPTSLTPSIDDTALLA
ncbi:MAG: hypothetical protein O3A51_09885 [Verrucomicrobia bacterium]|nr:hypothetical protein [Verrucomicrobiota bacterium]